MEEADVKGFVNKAGLPVLKSACPVDGYTKREYVKNLIKDINSESNGVKSRMFSAITNYPLKGWDSVDK